MSELLQSLIFAALGGLLYDFMLLYKDYQLPKDKRVEKDAWYWAFMVFWPLSGVILIAAYTINGSQMNGFPALMTGFTASTTLQTFLNETLKKQDAVDQDSE